MGVARGWVALVAAATVAGVAPAQEWTFDAPFQHAKVLGDHIEYLLSGGVRLTGGTLAIHADRAVFLLDADKLPDLDSSSPGLPTRGLQAPDPRRGLTEARLKQRLNAFLRAASGSQATTLGPTTFPIGTLHAMYLEGDVTVLQDDREVARADSMHFSAVDDRSVMRNAELRLWTGKPKGPQVFVLRGDLTRQGKRTTGQQTSITTCNAGEPHFEIALDDIEIIERRDDFDVKYSEKSRPDCAGMTSEA